MRSNRRWFRESRILVAIHEMTHGSGQGRVASVVLVDFVAQHPALFVQFVPPPLAELYGETQLTEDVWLRWKRATALEVTAPLIASLIGRGLVKRHSADQLRTTDAGDRAAVAISALLPADEIERVGFLAGEIDADIERSIRRLYDALEELSN